MKKLTTAIIALAILIILVITARIIFSRDHMMTAKTPDEAVKNYLEMMIPHHTEVVEASKVIMMDNTITKPEVRLLAARMADAQEFEITQMEGWYQDWFKTEYMFDPSMYHPSMTDPKDATGDLRAKIYLNDVIKHHKAAIDMSKDTHKQIEKLMKGFSKSDGTLTVTNSHPGIDTTLLFTEHVAEAQQKEIEEIKALLNVL